ncbi:HNH endonuclease [Citrobacter portucalensis]|uniref:HNH endonuclease n=1 Tax=Citrobacter portucalensis TaxID=1639133 RepID=UPI003896971B
MTSREKFEAWFQQKYKVTADTMKVMQIKVELAWEVWQAAESASEEQLEESQREFRAADATIHNLELKLTDMAVQLANAESKCRELAAENSYLLPKAASELSNAWVLHKYLIGIQAAIMHLDSGRKQAAQEWLHGTIAGPGFEFPNEVEVGDDIDAWAIHQMRDSISHPRALEIIKAETPATDTFLAEVTQEAVEPLKKEIEGLKKQLLMSVGDIRDLIDYNPENGVLTAKVNFSGRQAGSVIGSQTWQGYYAFSLFGKKCFAHRLAWLLHYGEWPSQPIDHINGIKTDNSIRNLRLCSLSQNQFNKPTQKNNTTGVKGVYWNKRDKRYVASVQFNGKKYSAGHHKDIDSAKEAVMKLREKLAGEFTNHGEFELAAKLRKGAAL